MRTVAELLDKAKECRSIPSDNGLAKVLGVSRAAVSEWRTGAKRMPDARVRELAVMAKQDPGEWLVAVHAAWAVGDEAKDWASVLARIASAACLVIALGVSVMPGKADAMAYQASSANTDDLYIMRSAIRWMARLKVAFLRPLWWLNKRSNTTWRVGPRALA